MILKSLIIVSLSLWLPVSVHAEIGVTKIKNVSMDFPIEMGDAFYFSGEDSNGYGLWKSDGTSGGTELVKSFGDERPVGFVNADGMLYFCGHETNTGYELWKSDGTPSGTMMVVDLYPGTDSSVGHHPSSCHIAYLDGKVFFSGHNASPGGPGTGLWKSDGTADNAVLVYDPNTSSIWGHGPEAMFVLDDTLYFTASGDDNLGVEWRKCEGPGYNSVSIVKDINTVEGHGGADISSPPPVLDGYFYFQGDDGTINGGTELWRSNGTDAGTAIVKDLNPIGDSRPEFITVVDNVLFFTVNYGSGYDLWKHDPTTDETVMVKDIPPPPPSGDANIDYFTAVGSTLYFTLYYNEVWKSDGTTSGTVKVVDVNLTGESDPRHLTPFESNIFFRADDGVKGDEVWMTDGSVGNASFVADIASGSDSSWPSNFFVFNDALFFRATFDGNVDEGEGDGLFRYGEVIRSSFSWNLFLPAIINGNK